MDFKDYIAIVPHWPQENVNFKDISPFLLEPKCFKQGIDTFIEKYKNAPINKIVGIDSRGFIFASVLAYELGLGFVLARKKGKLPEPKVSQSYDLEYGSATLEMKKDCLKKGDKVLIIDDVLATGGTFSAAQKLVEATGATVYEGAFLMDIRKEIGIDFRTETSLFSLISY